MNKKVFIGVLVMLFISTTLSAFAGQNFKIIFSTKPQNHSSSRSVYNTIYEMRFFSKIPYIPAKIIGEKLGDGKWIEKDDVYILAANNVFASFYPEKNTLVFKKNNFTHKVSSKIIKKDNHLYLPLDILKLFNMQYYQEASVCTVYATTRHFVYEKKLIQFSEFSRPFINTKPKLLTQYSTRFNSSYINRTFNVLLASQTINGLIIPPGEIFSFNNTLGQRTPNAGYKKAIIFINKQKVEDYGGGICQVSSTIYNAVYRAKLPVLQRKSHSIDVTYVPKGMDATVSFGLIDFVFRNNKKIPILLNTEVKKNHLVVKLFKY